jgi:hypothetical protein
MINENGEFAAWAALPILACTCSLHSPCGCDLAENRFTPFGIML